MDQEGGLTTSGSPLKFWKSALLVMECSPFQLRKGAHRLIMTQKKMTWVHQICEEMPRNRQGAGLLNKAAATRSEKGGGGQRKKVGERARGSSPYLSNTDA